MMTDETNNHSPPTTTDYVKQAIRDGILNGQYPLASRLDQGAIASELGVSLVPVREALRLLDGEGFVNIVPRRGVFVTDISAEGLEELYRIRESLEAMAVRLAVPKLSRPQKDTLRALQAEMKAAADDHSATRLIELNRLFHFKIYESVGYPYLLELITGLWNRTTLYGSRLFLTMRETAGALNQHQAILDGIINNDPQAAEQAMLAHIHETSVKAMEKWLSVHEVQNKQSDGEMA